MLLEGVRPICLKKHICLKNNPAFHQKPRLPWKVKSSHLVGLRVTNTVLAGFSGRMTQVLLARFKVRLLR